MGFRAREFISHACLENVPCGGIVLSLMHFPICQMATIVWSLPPGKFLTSSYSLFMSCQLLVRQFNLLVSHHLGSDGLTLWVTCSCTITAIRLKYIGYKPGAHRSIYVSSPTCPGPAGDERKYNTYMRQ